MLEVSIAGGHFFMRGALVSAGAWGKKEGARGAVATDALGISCDTGTSYGDTLVLHHYITIYLIGNLQGPMRNNSEFEKIGFRNQN